MNVLVIIYSGDAETIYNAMRLANIGIEKGDEVSVFMLGAGVTFEQVDSTELDVKGEIDKFEGDFYV